MPSFNVVLDTSAVLAWAIGESGSKQVHELLENRALPVFFHRQNATEVRYQVHRGAAVKAFFLANPGLVAANGKQNMTGLDFDDPEVFDAAEGVLAADAMISRLESSGIKIVGDERHPDLWKRASEIKSKHRRISLADCFGVALAIELDATFWTTDRHELQTLQSAGVASIHFIR